MSTPFSDFSPIFFKISHFGRYNFTAAGINDGENPGYVALFPIHGVARKIMENDEKSMAKTAAQQDEVAEQLETCEARRLVMSMVGVMGKIPAKIEFGNVDQAVCDLDVWGNEDDDRLVGLKARLNHAQTLFGRYGLWFDVLTDSNGLYPFNGNGWGDTIRIVPFGQTVACPNGASR